MAQGACFVGSLKADELANEALSEEALLFRLFHEDGVRVLILSRLKRPVDVRKSVFVLS